MSVVGESISTFEHVLLRSFLPRDKQMRVPDSNRRRLPRHERSALKLASHLAMTSFLFLALVVATWIASLAFHALHSVFPFPSDLLRFLDRLEIWLVYVDGALIFGTLMLGGLHYFLENLRGHS